MKKAVVICGPTASGKTALGVTLAKIFNGEVVSADSMQIYRGMDIGTAKPRLEEMDGIPHHMIDVAEPGEDWSVARYVEEAVPVVEDILARGKVPFIVGGTGLYIENLLAGRTFADFDPGRRQELTRRLEREGLDSLYAELGRVDPGRQQELHPNDEKRILRALEIYYNTGKTMSAFNEETRALPPRFAAAKIGLAFADRRDMWARIDSRVDKMMAEGLLEEVRGLLRSGVSPDTTAMQAIGYKEFTDAALGRGDVKAAAETVKLRSRQYGKRQLSWFRRDGDIHWITWDREPNFSQGVQDSTAFLKEWVYDSPILKGSVNHEKHK